MPAGRIFFAFVLLALLNSSTLAKTKFFPTGLLTSQELDEFRNDWYSKQLQAIQEGSLYETQPNHETYRLTRLRTFHHPMTFRLDIDDQCKATLTVKETDGAGGYQPGAIILNKTIEIARPSCEKLTTGLVDLKFWSLSTSTPELGADGAEWILEGAKSGNYHVVDRWSPSTGAFYEWALSLSVRPMSS